MKKKELLATALLATMLVPPLVSSAIEKNIQSSIDTSALKPANPSGFMYGYGHGGNGAMTYYRNNGTFGAVAHHLEDRYDQDKDPFVYYRTVVTRNNGAQIWQERAEIMSDTRAGAFGVDFEPRQREIPIPKNLRNISFGEMTPGEALMITSGAENKIPGYVKVHVGQEKTLQFLKNIRKDKPKVFTVNICQTTHPGRSIIPGESGSPIIQYNHEENRYEIIGGMHSRLPYSGNTIGLATHAKEMIQAELETHEGNPEIIESIIDTEANQKTVDQKLSTFNAGKRIWQPAVLLSQFLGSMALIKSSKKEEERVV